MPREPQKNVRIEVVCPESKVKAFASGKSAEAPHGGLEGYLAVYGNIDSDGEVFDKGTFAKSIREQINDGKGVPLMTRHFRDGGDVGDAVGTIYAASEDEFGLYIKARFASTPDAQEVRTKAQEGIVRGLSVGFMPIRWEWEKEGGDEDGDMVLHFKEAKISEGTITLRPSNKEAHITAAKADAERLRKYDERLARIEEQIATLNGTAKADDTDRDESAAATHAAADVDQWLAKNARELTLRGVR